MIRKIILILVLSPFVAQLWGSDFPPTAQYYKTSSFGMGCYKTEAIRQMVTPLMEAQAGRWSADPRVQEVVTMARAVDTLFFDGFRLVRIRGVLLDNGPIDDFAVYRAVFYFNVTPTEARAWLLASRLMQLSRFKDDGAALWVLEKDLSETAADLGQRVRTYFGDEGVVVLMPHFAGEWGYGGWAAPHAPYYSREWMGSLPPVSGGN